MTYVETETGLTLAEGVIHWIEADVHGRLMGNNGEENDTSDILLVIDIFAHEGSGVEVKENYLIGDRNTPVGFPTIADLIDYLDDLGFYDIEIKIAAVYRT